MFHHLGRSALDSIIDGLPGDDDSRHLVRESVERWGPQFLEPFKIVRDDRLTYASQRLRTKAQLIAPIVPENVEDLQLMLSPEYVPVPIVGHWGMPPDVPLPFELSSQKFSDHWRARRTLLRRYSSWKKVLRLCMVGNACPLPMTPGTAVGVVSAVADSGVTYSDVRAVRECITFVHTYKGYPDPTTSEAFKRVWAGITRRLTTANPYAKIALTRAEVGEMIRHAVRRRRYDHAVSMAVAFEGALRGSEVCALQVEDVYASGRHVRLLIRRSKTDQISRGAWVPLEYRQGAPFDASAMVMKWIEATKRTKGFLLSPMRHGRITGKPLDPRTFGRMLKHYGACLATPIDPAQIGTHSLRAGWATTELELSRPDVVVARHLNHESLATLLRYYRPRVRSRNFTRFADAGDAR